MRAFSTMSRVFFLFVSALVFLFSAESALADFNVKICGETTYKIEFTEAIVRVTKIQNFEPGGKSGSLSLVLWATTEPYKGGDTLTGTVFFDYNIGQIDGGKYLSPTGPYAVPYEPPPPGNYYVTLALNEYTTEGLRMRDYLTYDQVVALGNVNDTYSESKNNGCNPLPPDDQGSGPAMDNEREWASETSGGSGCFFSSLLD